MSGLAPLAAEKTREVFWDFEPALEVLWYLLAGVSVLVFAYGVARPIAKYRRAHGGGWPPPSELPRRFREALRILLSHVSIKRRDPYAGWAHRGIFYGFVVLFIGTVILGINTDFTEPVLGWRFFEGNFYLGYSIVLDVLGMALLAGLVLMMIRRGILRPRKLDYARPDRDTDERTGYRVGDWTFVGILLVLAISGYVLEGARIAMDQPGYDEFSPAGWVVAQGFDALGASDGALRAVRHALWWSHGLLAIAFVASIPYTKAAHMLTSFGSLVVRDPQAGKRLKSIPAELLSEPAGYATLADFSGVHLLHLDACTKCGKCHEACPALATGRPLSPRDVVLELREQSNAAMQTLGIGGVLGVLIKGQQAGNGTFDRPVVRDDGVRADTVWSCMQCNACVEACPVGIEQAPIINQLRRRLVEEGELPANLQTTFETIQKSGNSFGERARKRGRWTEELDFDVKDARKESVDVVWFVGDYASFDPRSQNVSRSLARIFRAAGLDFGILYEGESNSGNDVRRAGEEGLFEALAEYNIATLAQHASQRVSGACVREARRLVEGDASHRAAARADRGRATSAQGPQRVHGDLPRPLLPRTPQRRLRGAATDPRTVGVHARRDASQPRQLVLLRRGRRAHLDPGRARCRAPVREPDPRGHVDREARLLRGQLPERRDDVRGCNQDLGPRRPDRVARADRADRGTALISRSVALSTG